MTSDMRNVGVLVKQELRVLGSDPFPIFLLIVTPLLMLAFMSKAFIGGTTQVVPGFAVLFGFFGLSVIGHSFFRDHGWRTWDRLRCSSLHPNEILAGKIIPLAFLLIVQQFVIVYASTLFGLDIRGSILSLFAVFVAVALVELGLGLLLVGISRSIQQISAIATVGALLLGGLGGALSPVGLLPGWAQTVGRGTPIYWALRGLRGALEAQPLSDRLFPLGVLLVFATVSFTLAVLLFRAEDVKRFYG